MARMSGELVGNRAVFDFDLSVLEKHLRFACRAERRRKVEDDFPCALLVNVARQQRQGTVLRRSAETYLLPICRTFNGGRRLFGQDQVFKCYKLLDELLDRPPVVRRRRRRKPPPLTPLASTA